jgi:hypothetical protein
MKNIIWPLLLLFSLHQVFAGEVEEYNGEEVTEASPDVHPEDMGRTYHDEEQTMVKEVYSFKEVQRFNPRRPEEGIQIDEVKDGAYFRYYKNGQLEVMGTFHDGKKHGAFRYFDEDGKEVKTVRFSEGNKQQ